MTASQLRNNPIGWLPSRRVRLAGVPWSLVVDLSRRALYVRREGKTVRRITLAVGARRHPAPGGRFAVTECLKVLDELALRFLRAGAERPPGEAPARLARKTTGWPYTP